MSTTIIFFIGCLVSVFVAAAVGLLMWGAANEPRGTLLPEEPRAETPPARSQSRAPAARKPETEPLVG